VAQAVARLKARTNLPVAVGFGIRTPQQAADIARVADAAVVGSAIVVKIAEAAARGARRTALLAEVTDFCRSLADAVHAARTPV
jgi:tryptophan synthase alpha chain